MKKLLASLIFVVVALFVVDRIGGQVMWWVNQHTHDISGPKLKYLADEVNEDVILLGTSRCNFHYVPSILSDSIGMSVYNGGIDASNCIYAQYFVLNQILRHHTPKMIGLELSINDYIPSEHSFESTSFFAPYIGRSERADSIFREAGNYYAYKFCHLYRYNAKAVSNIGGLLINKQQQVDHGYIPLPEPAFHPEKLEKIQTPDNIDTLKLEYMQRFISLCKANNIQLVLMVSPVYNVADADLYDPLKDLAAKNNVPFLDYHTTHTFLNHPEYFKDTAHLWHQGAAIYTSLFASDLKKIMRKECCNE